ncbi:MULTISPECIES: RnfH family protein [Silvimonas]|uniref:UPF0125 protein HNQ50_001220 n=2 Tax=Silvimonas TaxID=300264 RepID=A0A840RD83_9NEIS|nr:MULTISPECIES: RnfH family protein [Silvimonas]MBB5190498.1 hypothetical protein [Silvimonas terrae]GGP24266.1 UPF0125 protein [Silvimonas amylolytica]
MSHDIVVEVVYATRDKQKLLSVKVPEGTTAEEAVRRSGILAEFPEIDLAVNKLGIFAKAVKPDTVLREKDRVEIYRPLIADPKEVRRQRAAEGKVMKKGGGNAEE